MTNKQIETSREIRLWIGQVLIPAVGVSAALFSNPQIRYAASQKLGNIKQSIQQRRVKAL